MSTLEVGAHEITKTHYCKAPGCTNEARSPVGRYAYCPDHQGTATARRDVAASTNGAATTEAALRSLLSLAKKVDRAKVKAEKARRAATAAEKAADAIAAEYREALASAAAL